jgi:phage baseplate assembly protein W
MAFETKLRGIIAPFRRDGISDFRNGTGAELVRAHLEQIIGVGCSNGQSMQGEYPWDPSFGSQIDQLRHRNVNDPITQSIAETFVVDAITKWMTSIRVTSVELREVQQSDGRYIRVINIWYQNVASSARAIEELSLPLRLAG